MAYSHKDTAELLSALGECIEALRSHLADLNGARLEALLETMPSISAAGSAEMVLTMILYREIQSRDRANVVSFPSRA